MRIDDIITKVVNSLDKIWDDLKEQYHVKTDFVVCSTSQYVELENAFLHIDRCEKPLNVLIQQLSANDNSGCIIETLSNISIDGNKRVHVHQIICMQDAILYELILKNIGRIELLIDYLKQSLLHEMGHILCNLEYENKTLEEWCILREEKIAENRQAREYAKQIDDNDEYLLAYFNLPDERMANDRVGLTADDMVKMDKAISQPMNIKIEVLKDE